MSKSLLEFYQNKDLKENVHAYLVEFLEKEAVKKVFDREDVSAVAEAKEMIDKAFENMDVLFAVKKEPKEQVNESR